MRFGDMSDELTEFVDAEIFVTGADDPAEEKRLLSSLEGHEGVAKVAIAQGRVDVHYDPTAITKAELAKRIEAEGFKIKEMETAASSPIVDTLPEP